MKKLSLKPKCTCGAKHGRHRLDCDLFWSLDKKLRKKMIPKKRKRFGFFYPLKKVK